MTWCLVRIMVLKKINNWHGSNSKLNLGSVLASLARLLLDYKMDEKSSIMYQLLIVLLNKSIRKNVKKCTVLRHITFKHWSLSKYDDVKCLLLCSKLYSMLNNA